MQSLIRLPKDLVISIAGAVLKIENHRVKTPSNGLMAFMLDLCRFRTAKQMAEMEKTIQFEAVIEYCAEEMDENHGLLAGIIVLHYGASLKDWNEFVEFSNSIGGRLVAGRLVEKIRNCDDWEEFWVELQVKSQFNADIKQTITRSMKRKNLFVETCNHPNKK